MGTWNSYSTLSHIRSVYNILSVELHNMRHFTESVNTRFEVGMIKLLDEVVESEWCQRQGMNRSDLVRHLVRIGIKNFHDNQPKNRELKN
jgi:hypothetical protein